MEGARGGWRSEVIYLQQEPSHHAHEEAGRRWEDLLRSVDFCPIDKKTITLTIFLYKYRETEDYVLFFILAHIIE